MWRRAAKWRAFLHARSSCCFSCAPIKGSEEELIVSNSASMRATSTSLTLIKKSRSILRLMPVLDATLLSCANLPIRNNSGSRRDVNPGNVSNFDGLKDSVGRFSVISSMNETAEL